MELPSSKTRLPRPAHAPAGARAPRPGNAVRSRGTLALMVCFLAIILLYTRFSLRGGPVPELASVLTPVLTPTPARWASSFLHAAADPQLTARLDGLSRAHRFARCKAGPVRVAGFKGWISVDELEDVLAAAAAAPAPGAGAGAGGSNVSASPAGQRFVEVEVQSVPCSADPSGCCAHTFVFRPGTTDFKVFRQLFAWHYMRFLYGIFDARPPAYVLDAGANAGFSAVLFKLAWPGATVVALEPDSGNFEALERQVAGLEGVQPLRGALWGRRARVAQVGQHEGDWGRVFEALDPGAPAPPGGALSIDAYSVSDVAALAGVPAFDFVKIDIEGAEGRVFDPEAGTDVAWLPAARVISLEVHDYFAGYFGLQDVSTNIESVMGGRPFAVASDNEHVLFLSADAVAALPAAAAP